MGRPTLLRLGDSRPPVQPVSAGGVAIVLVVVAAIGVTLFAGRSSGPSSSESFVLGATAESTPTPSAPRRARARRDGREKPRFAPRRPANSKPASSAPANSNPANSAPANSNPTNPKPANSNPANSAPASPEPANPKPAKPTPAKPTRANSAPADSKPANPKPAEPTPAKPTPAGPTGGAAPLGSGMPGAVSAEAFVARYYAALNDRRFADAWRSLGPGVRASFGGFESWQRGFKRTVASVPTGIEVTRGPGGAKVSLTLRAGDRAPCGDTVVRRYAVTWQLARTDAGWLATGASGRPLGVVRAASC